MAEPVSMLTEQYRPYFLADLIGQASAKRTIGAWLRTGRIPRSILIEGSGSTGKTTLARIIARTSMCQSPKEGSACTVCPSCKAFDAGRHPDYVEMNSASDRGIDAMRSLASKVQMLPALSRRRVVVMDEAHEVTKNGWGAMLKPLEEPPQHVVFLIVTTNPEKVLDTIISRCSKVHLSDITVDECVTLLEDVAKKTGLGKAGITQDNLRKIAQVVGAKPRKALHALDQVYTMVLDATDTGTPVDAALVNTFIKDVATTDVETLAAGIVNSILQGKPGGALKRAEDGWSQADLLLSKITEMMRQAMMLSTNPKLVDRLYEHVFKDCDIFKFTLPSEKDHLLARKAILDSYSAFTQTRIMTGNFTVPIAEVIGEPIARASLICQTFLKDHKGDQVVRKDEKAKASGKQAPAA